MRLKKDYKYILILVLLYFLYSCNNLESSSIVESTEAVKGIWCVGAISHEGNIVDIHDVPGLEDLYDTTILTFSDDGSFWLYNMVTETGTWEYKNGKYILKVEKAGIGLLESDLKSVEEKYKYIVEIIDWDTNTLLLNKYDPLTGKPSADSEPMIYVKDGCESEYVKKEKLSLK